MRRFGLLSLAVPVALAIAAVLPTNGWAAQRCVLGEYFNATW
jgi:hypothetical protein